MGKQVELFFRINILRDSSPSPISGLFNFQDFFLMYLLRISFKRALYYLNVLSYKNCHFKTRGQWMVLFSVPMKCIQTGSTNRYFKLDQVDIEVAHPDVLCSDFA